MNRTVSFYVAVCLLAILGFAIAIARHQETGIPFTPGQENTVWDVEARIDFSAMGEAVTVSLSLPEEMPGFTLLSEQAASPGFGFAILNDGEDRRGEWTKREVSGAQSLYYTVRFSEHDDPLEEVVEQTPDVASVFWEDAQGIAAEEALNRARSTSSSPESFTRELIKLFNGADTDQNMALLLSAEDDNISGLLKKLLNQAGIPARITMGLLLEDARRRQRLTPMVEVFTGDSWLLFNPETGVAGIPEDFLLWHRDGISVLDVTGGVQSRVSFSIIQQSLPVQLISVESGTSLFRNIGIHRLPIEEQSMFKLLLLLPLGAVVVVFMRVMVGLQTAGTFMPILISMAFLQSSLWPGLISFVSVVAIGLTLRGSLSRLNLLLVARIATLLVLVVFIISALSIIGYEMGYSTGMTITFFPMIIIAWTIERMSILWEEEGAKEVLIQGGGSLLVAVITYQLMVTPLLTHLTFNFPEVNLILLAAILAMGQYTGYKLSEMHRFRAMDDRE